MVNDRLLVESYDNALATYQNVPIEEDMEFTK